MSVTQDFLKAAGGQRSQHSHLGKWATQLSKVVQGGPQPGVKLVDLLKAAQGEISLHTAFGRMAMQLSQEVDSGSVDKDEVGGKFLATKGMQQILSHYGDFQASAIFRAP